MEKLSRIFACLKCLVASMVLASTPSGAQQPKPEPTVVAGSEVSLSSIKKAQWIQGEGPEFFEPGKVYIFECWATWCGPCIAMIPHVNELHKKYYDRGLRVYGVSVWEDDKDKVKKFIKKKGDEMSYPVAFTGNGSAFETQWLKAAGTEAIPHVFIVRNGKLLASTQASRLTDSLIETLLSGDEGAKKAADTILSAQKNQVKTDQLMRDSYSARKKQDATKMTALLKEMKASDPAHPEIPTMELWVLIIKKEWPAAVKALEELPASESKTSFVSRTGSLLGRTNNHDYPADFMKVFIKLYSDYVLRNESPIGPNHYAYLSMQQWRMGDKKNATITANKSVEAAKNFRRSNEYFIKSFERFAKSVNEGTMPTTTDLSKWYREAKQEAEAAKKKKTKD